MGVHHALIPETTIDAYYLSDEATAPLVIMDAIDDALILLNIAFIGYAYRGKNQQGRTIVVLSAFRTLGVKCIFSGSFIYACFFHRLLPIFEKRMRSLNPLFLIL